MKKRNVILAVLCLALGFALVACSDDDVEKMDKGPTQKEAGADKGTDGVTGDVGVDAKVKVDISADGVTDDMTPPDLGPDKGPDMTIAKCLEAGVDAKLDTGTTTGDTGTTVTPDASTAPATNTKCAHPLKVTLTNNKATVTGDTGKSVDEYATVDCKNTNGPWSGPQLYYLVTLPAGKTMNIELSSTWDPSLYAFPAATACGATTINAACSAKTAYNSDIIGSGSKETITITPATTGDWVVVVDSWDSSEDGVFTLTFGGGGTTSALKNDDCKTPEKMTFKGTTATATGDTTKATDKVKLTSTGCTSKATPGGDLFYAVDLIKGKNYRVTATPSSSFNVAAYVFTDCTKVAATCLAGADSQYSGSAEKVLFSPPSSGTYLIGVDSQYTAGSSLSYGSFSLTVSEVITPKNDTCASATAMTFSGGAASAKGDTTNASDKVNFTSTSSCAKSTAKGGDLFYSASLSTGKSYKVEVIPESSYDTVVYVYTSCSSAAATCLAGADSKSSGGTETFIFTPAVNGTHYFAVDSDSASYSGKFTLKVSEYVKPTNGTCAKAHAIPLPCAAIQGDTMGSTNEYSTNIKCGGSSAFDGPQVYYQLDLKANQTYKIGINPTFTAYMYIFPKTACGTAATIEAACSGTDGVKGGSFYSGSVKYMYFTPKKAGAYILAVDSTSDSYNGSFKLYVSEFQTAKNYTCAKAQAMTLVSGKASVKGDTTGVPDEHSTLKCGTSSTLLGAQVYYKVALSAAKAYTFTLKPSFYSYLYFFPATACGDATKIGTACGSSGKTGNYTSVSSGSTGTLTFAPATSGDYIIAVDAYSASYFGSFSLDVAEFTPPANDTCKMAKVLTLVGGKATVTAVKVGATNKLAKCGSQTLPATDLFYKFTPVVGKTYKITFKPTSNNGGRFGVWDGSHNCVDSAVETACGVLGSSYVSSGSTGSLSITSKSGDIYLVADGISSSMYDVYNYSFEIAQQ